MASSAARCHGGCVSRSGQCLLVLHPEQRGGAIERGDVIDWPCLVAGHLAGDRACLAAAFRRRAPGSGTGPS